MVIFASFIMKFVTIYQNLEDFSKINCWVNGVMPKYTSIYFPRKSAIQEVCEWLWNLQFKKYMKTFVTYCLYILQFYFSHFRHLAHQATTFVIFKLFTFVINQSYCYVLKYYVPFFQVITLHEYMSQIVMESLTTVITNWTSCFKYTSARTLAWDKFKHYCIPIHFSWLRK